MHNEHWTVLFRRAEEALRAHGASMVEQERDWLIATWLDSTLAAKPVVRMVVGTRPEVEELTVEYAISLITTVERLESVAAVLAKAAQAWRAIDALRSPRPA